MARFQDQVVLISGGGTGIGRAAAVSFLAEGARVFVTGRREAPLRALEQEYGARVAWRTADVSQSGDAQRVIDAALERFGRLDVLVNNAGVLAVGPLVELSDQEAERVFAVNVLGLVALSRAAIPALSQTQGSILNISSVVSRSVMAGTAIYSASKAAVDQLTRVLAAELGPVGVRVNAISPGMTVTDMSADILDDATREGTIAQTPMGRLGEPADIADAIALLADARASWITGQIVEAAGGFRL